MGGGWIKLNIITFSWIHNLQLGYMWKSLQLSVICEHLVTLFKELTYLELFNTFLITQAKTPKQVGHQSYISEINLATRDTFLRLSWPVKS